MALSDRQLPSAPYEDISAEYATLTEATSSLPGAINGNSTPHRSITPDDEPADIYVCTADYVPDSRDELSITEGMKCIVLERNDDGMSCLNNNCDIKIQPRSCICLVPNTLLIAFCHNGLTILI